MIESNVDIARGRGHIVLSPNQSAQWRVTKIFLWLTSCYMLLIASLFALAGLWMVFPFAGIEVIALVVLMSWVACQCRCKQVIYLCDNRIRIEKGYRSPRVVWDSEIFWTRLIIDKAPYRGHPNKLILRSKQQQLEIGEFLNEHDKKKLITELRNVINN